MQLQFSFNVKGRQSPTTQGRFWAGLDKGGELFNGQPCWLWLGPVDKDGYGRLYTHQTTDRKVVMQRVHRFAWELFYGPMSEGLQIDHLCRNRRCVNPTHLEPVTCKVNIRRGMTGKLNNHQTRKTCCPRGHPYDRVNGTSGARYCRACQNAAARAAYWQQKEV